MRMLLVVTFLALMPLSAEAQRKKVVPVKVIELNRKEPVSYEKDIEPIFYKRCVACHSGSIKEGRFDVSSYENIIKGGKRGSPVVPGKAEKSFLYVTLTREERPFMPPRSEDPVTPEELALVKLWIDQGAKAPTGERIRPKIIVNLPPALVTPVRAVAVSPDKSTVVASRGNQIHVYDANTGTHIRSLVTPNLETQDKKKVDAAHISLVESMAFSPDGKYLASGSFQEVAVWDVQTGVLRKRLEGFAHNVVDLMFSPDSKLLATAGGAPTEDGEIRIFDVATWNKVTDIKGAHSDTVYGLTFSPDSKYIATGSADKFVKVFEVPSGKFVKSFEGHTHHVLDVGWSSDGKLLASAGADNAVKIWDFEKGEQQRTVNAAGGQLTRLKWIGKTPDFVICAGDGTMRYIRSSNGGTVRNFGGNKDFVYAVDVSADGNLTAAGGEEGVVRVYNGANGQLLRTLTPPGATPEEKKK